MIKVSDRQHEILFRLRRTPMTHPRGTLECLAKKGLATGDKRQGYSISMRGIYWLKKPVT
jgi:hypothetical protein